jgi:hypothetical protein
VKENRRVAHAPFANKLNRSTVTSQSTHKRHQILLLLVSQLRTQHQVKVLHCVSSVSRRPSCIYGGVSQQQVPENTASFTIQDSIETFADELGTKRLRVRS